MPKITINLPFQSAPGFAGGKPDYAMWEEFLAQTNSDQPQIISLNPIVQIPGSALDQDEATLKGWAQQFYKLCLPLSVVANPIQSGFVSAQDSFNRFNKIITKWINCGGPLPMYIECDDPFAMGFNLNMDLDTVAGSIADFISFTYAMYPKMHIYVDGTFPGNKIIADSVYNCRNIEAIQDKLSSGVYYLYGWRMDVDAAANPNWNDLAAIQDYCDEDGTNFSLICDSVGAWKQSQKQAATTEEADQIWLSGLQAQATAYKGTRYIPDDICIRSWTGTPSSLTTFIRGALAVVDIFGSDES